MKTEPAPRSVEPAVPGDQAPRSRRSLMPHGQVREAQRGERLGGRQDQLDLRPPRDATPEHVDVALGELAEAALLGPLRPPHRADLDGLERLGQPGVVLGVVARQRHRQVEAQAEVGQLVAPRRRGGLELLAALEDLEDQLLVLAAVAAGGAAAGSPAPGVSMRPKP